MRKQGWYLWDCHAVSVSEKMIEIVGGVDVDGEGDSGYASRTGANRQRYNVGYFARAEVGKRKRLSCVDVIAGDL